MRYYRVCSRLLPSAEL
jgi:hypothetical protein